MSLGKALADERPLVAEVVAAVRQLVQDGVGQCETTTAHTHVIGHVGMGRPEGVKLDLNSSERVRMPTDLQL